MTIAASASSDPKTLLERLFTLDNLLQALGVVGGLWGNYLINQTSAAGFLLWLVSNGALAWLQFRTRLFGLVLLHLAYLYLCFQGIASWATKAPESLSGWVPKWLVSTSQLVAG
jgi:nicotinamide riboside transporter PnuC